MESLKDLEKRASELMRPALEDLDADPDDWAERSAGLARQAYPAGYGAARAAQAEGRDLAALARAVQWARVIAGAALPPGDALSRPLTSAGQADRMAMRLAAFRAGLDEVRKHGPCGDPADLDLLRGGSVPGHAAAS